jgi:acetyltransferase-like isoleucine patch superfamily enzyme
LPFSKVDAASGAGDENGGFHRVVVATIGKPIVIERGVWIAASATIIGGVTIGENTVIAAGSVVTKDVLPNTLAGGNPARVIRSIGD